MFCWFKSVNRVGHRYQLTASRKSAVSFKPVKNNTITIMSDRSGHRFNQLLYIAGALLLISGILLIASLLYGIEPTKQWIVHHPALSVFLMAAVISFFPAYEERGHKLKRVWKETNKTLIILTVASFFVAYRSRVVTPSHPLVDMLYELGSRAWYFTGFMLLLNLAGLPLASILHEDD
mgnify:CR=1 FL=1